VGAVESRQVGRGAERYRAHGRRDAIDDNGEGAYLGGRCEYRDGEVVGLLDAGWLREAKAPVLVDPMVETVGETESRSVGLHVSFYYVYWKTFLEMALPDISGGTVTGVVLKATVDLVAHNTTIFAYVEDPDNAAPAWTSAATIATMNSVDDDLIQDGSVAISSTGEKSWDVTTTITAMYAGAASTATIMLTGAAEAKSDGLDVVATWHAGDDKTPTNLFVYDIGFDETAAPELEVTYDAGGVSRTPSPGVAIGGVLRF